jgi:hypothetical protein
VCAGHCGTAAAAVSMLSVWLRPFLLDAYYCSPERRVVHVAGLFVACVQCVISRSCNGLCCDVTWSLSGWHPCHLIRHPGLHTTRQHRVGTPVSRTASKPLHHSMMVPVLYTGSPIHSHPTIDHASWQLFSQAASPPTTRSASDYVRLVCKSRIYTGNSQ